MQAPAGMARVARSDGQAQLRQAAHWAQQQNTQVYGIEQIVREAIENWQRDQDAGHLLRAIAALQNLVQISAGLAQQAAGAVQSATGGGAASGPRSAAPTAVSGSTHSFQSGPRAPVPMPIPSFSSPSAPGPMPAGPIVSAGEVAEAARQAAENILRNVRSTASGVRSAVEQTVRSLTDAAGRLLEAERGAREEGLHGGLMNPARQAGGGGFGGRTSGSTGGGGFGGRAAGSIPQR